MLGVIHFFEAINNCSVLKFKKLIVSRKCNVLLTKYFQPFEGVWCFWKKLGVNIGVRCYLHIFSHILEGVRCYLKIIEAIMCFLGVIEVFLVLRV